MTPATSDRQAIESGEGPGPIPGDEVIFVVQPSSGVPVLQSTASEHAFITAERIVDLARCV